MSDPTQVVSSESFYFTSGTLPPDALSYIYRAADTQLLEGLRRGEFCYLLTSRQMGKSSLMVQTARRLRQEGTTCFLIDLTAVGISGSEEQWYRSIFGQISRFSDELEEAWEKHQTYSPLQRFMRTLEAVLLAQIPGPIVLFIDEIDTVRALSFSADELFAGIRECHNRRAENPELRRLSFCLLGVATPTDLMRDTRLTPFNIGQRIHLTDLAPADASRLRNGLNRPSQQSEILLERVFYWTGGHPYLTQRLCQAVAEDDQVSEASDVDRLCADLFFLVGRQQWDDPNLTYVRDQLVRVRSAGESVDQDGLLDLYGRVRQKKFVKDDRTSPLVETLRLSGIVRTEGAFLKVRNRIYAHVFDPAWVRENMSDAESKRRQAAFNQGLIRALAASAGIIAIVTGLAIYAFSQTNRANHNADLAIQARNDARIQADSAEHISYIATLNLVQYKWDANELAHVAELLNSTRSSPSRGFEWGYWNHLLHVELLRLNGYDGHARCAAVSPDGRRIVTGWGDTVCIWDAGTGRQLLIMQGDRRDKDDINAIAFSPDGKHIATGGYHSIRMWDTATRQQSLRFKADPGFIDSVAFSADGKRIVTGGTYNRAKVWDAETGRQILDLTGCVSNAVAYSPDGRLIATGYPDEVGNQTEKAYVWDAKTGRRMFTFKGHTGGVNSITFSADSKRILIGSGENNASLWDAATGNRIITFKGHEGPVYSAVFSPNGTRIVTGSADGTARFWDIVTGRQIFIIKGYTRGITFVAFSSDGRRLITNGYDNTVRVWDAVTSRETLTVQGAKDGISSVAFSPDGQRIFTGGANNVIWSTVTGRQVLTLNWPTGDVESAAFSPDGKRIVGGGLERGLPPKVWGPAVRVWDAGTGQQICTLTGHTGYVNAVAFSPDSTRVVTGSDDKTVRVWDAATGKQTLILNGFTSRVVSVAFSHDGKSILTGSIFDPVKVWDSVTGLELLTLKGQAHGVSIAAFSPDGKRILTVGVYEDSVKVWDTKNTDHEILTLRGHTGILEAVAFSPDGKRIVTGGEDHTVRVWDAATGRELLTLKGHTQHINSVAFSPDSKSILSGSRDSTAKVWLSDFDSSP